jgi:hypothetical protein
MTMRRKIGSLCMAAAGLALAGCGGSDYSAPPPPAPAPAPPPAPASITIAGTAVQGAALGGAAVSVKCATGSGTATTTASGAFTMTITDGALPCVVKAVGTNGTTYHSLVAGTGSTGTFTANASPLTEMVVSQVGAMDPAAYFAAFGSASSVPASSIATANAYLQAALGKLTDLTGVNPLTDTLAVGNGLDQKIDAVVTGLKAAGVTVADMTKAIVQNPATPGVIASAAAPVAADCPWLKSGTYMLIQRVTTVPEERFLTIEIDAKALLVKAGSDVVPMTSDGSCQFTVDDTEGTSKVIVSAGGLIFAHFQSKTVASDRDLAIAVPIQSLPIAEGAGTWNFAAWVPANIPVAGRAVAANVDVTVDSAGQVTSSNACVGLYPCVAATPPFDKFVANAAGGVDVLDGSGAVVGRSFLYKTLAGDKVAVNLRSDNTLAIGMPMKPLALPEVGRVTKSRSVEFDGNGSDTTSTLTEDTVTVTATDSAAKTVTRLRTSDNRVDTITYDKPRDGLRYRAGNSCTKDGAPFNCSETVQLRLPGMGITLSLSAAPKPTQQFYQFSIDEP